ncbi:MAG TPA: DUF3025 domain-containing protein, partial [Polyangiaceae bacterium]
SEHAFRAAFFEESPLFWPIAPAARPFAAWPDWPPVEAYALAFGAMAAPVRFEEQPLAQRRRRRVAVDPAALYDARIAREGRVPTRARSWHDFLNALVWATFPRAKRALHARQLRALEARIDPGARVLPATRSREHDALALIDEGGVVALDDGRSARLVLFGHALYEGLVLRRGAMTACTIRLAVADVHLAERDAIARAEEAVLARLAATELDPRDFERLTIPAA